MIPLLTRFCGLNLAFARFQKFEFNYFVRPTNLKVGQTLKNQQNYMYSAQLQKFKRTQLVFKPVQPAGPFKNTELEHLGF